MANTNNSDVLATVSTNIDTFIALPVYSKLANFPSSLKLEYFVPSKENSNDLKGTQNLFRSCDFVADFALPDPIAMPDPSDFADTAKGFKEYKDALEAFKLGGKIFNDEIKALQARIYREDIERKYRNLCAGREFVKQFDVSMFEVDDSLDIWEFSQTIRDRILAVYETNFKANPVIDYKGGSYRFDLSEVDGKPSKYTLLTVAGIDAIIAEKEKIANGEIVFLSQDVCIQALKTVKNDLNAGSIMSLITRLNSNAGSKQNATSTLKNLKLLVTGIAPKKGKATA